MPGKVIDLSAARERSQTKPLEDTHLAADEYPHMVGEAFCLGCGHTWHADRKVGPDSIRFPCPACSAFKGYFKFEARLPDSVLVATCQGCEGQLFYLTPDGHLCPNCGEYRRY